MPNIPRSPNGQFTRQPLNQTPNSRIPPSAPILDLPHVRVQGGSEEVRSENLDGQEVVDSIRSGQTTPVPESSVPLTSETPSNATLGEVLRQLAMVATQLVSASSLAPPRPRPAFRTPEMKKPDSFDGSSPAKLRNYLQQCKLIFRNDIDSFSSDLKKTLYAAAFLTGKAFEWVQPYLEVIDDPPPNYMMNSWLMFESQLVTLYGDPMNFKPLNTNGDHASNYISSFEPFNLAYQDGETAHSHFRKGLPTRVLDLLAQNTEVFDTLSELIEATLKIDTRHHERQKEKKRENGSQPTQPKKDTSKTTSSSTPSTSRNPSTSKSTSKTPSEITKVLEGGRLMANEKERRAKAGSYFEQWKNNCVELPSASDPIDLIDPSTSSSKICLLQTKSSNQLRFILFHNNSPYSVLLDSGATRSFISQNLIDTFSFPTSALEKPIPLFSYSSSSEPMQWLSKKTLWTFKISSFPIFSWECLVIDATGNDDAILGYDFLTHWNPDINWSEGLIIPCALPPEAPIKLPSSSFSQESVSLRSLIAMSSNGSLPDDLHPPGNPSTFIPSVVYLASQDESYDFETEEVLIRSITTGSRQEVFEGDFFDDPPADLETILPTIPLEYHEFASLFSTILADQLPPQRACDHRIDLLGPVPKKGTIYRLLEPEDKVL
ncbi:hypothetical protein H4Q26_003262 [Puccinia striiformis f. sp. tritici PST-130]|nr:hypothetical protein H4Q26_003262 [Puccinia striiformis f. sp. tritici PST-130]